MPKFFLVVIAYPHTVSDRPVVIFMNFPTYEHKTGKTYLTLNSKSLVSKLFVLKEFLDPSQLQYLSTL